MQYIGVLSILLFVSLLPVHAGEMEEIHNAAVKAETGDINSIKSLYKISLSTKNEAIKPYLIRAVTMTMLKTRSKSLVNYIKTVQNHRNGKNLLLFLETKPIKIPCNSCKELGKTLEKCTTCKTGECLKCEGLGTYTKKVKKEDVSVNCEDCKTSGFCKDCKGSKKAAIVCKDCKGFGSNFNPAVYSAEEKRAYQALIHKSAFLSEDVDFKADQSVISEDDKMMAQSIKWLKDQKKKKAAFEKKEKQRLAKASGTEEYKPLMTEGSTVQEDFENGKSTEKLDQLCKEVGAYIKAQERRSKMDLMAKIYGEYKSDIPTVFLVLKNDFTSQSKEWRLRTAQGFYEYAKLRGMTAGYDKIGFIVTDQNGKILAKVNH